ncbi:MAG: leucine-rich repeat domain-containing protein, partial [Bacillota bacterium]|nr:leucine-rich repeat domain-containing protein [Bacillota bacterium]
MRKFTEHRCVRICALMLAFIMFTTSFGYCAGLIGNGTKSDPWHGDEYINLRFYVDGDTLYMKTDNPEQLTEMDRPRAGKTLPWAGLNVTKLDISLGAWVVGTEDFANGVLPNLQSVTIHDGVKYIEARAFADNPNLTSIVLPDAMTSIKEYAFANTGIESLTMPGDFSPGIVEGLFSGCSKLTTVTTPWDCDRIDQNAFDGCNALETINYNGTISEWSGIRIASGNNPVYQAKIVCSDGEVPRKVYNLGNATAYLRNGMLYIKGNGAIAANNKPWNGEKITSIIIEEGITSLPDSLFSNTTTLERVTFPSTLVSIGNDAFSGCDNLSSVDFNGASVQTIGSGAFRDCSNLESIALPDDLTKINAECFKGCTYLRSISIPATVKEVGNGAFEGCSKLSVDFGGTSSEWASIVFGEGNDALGVKGIVFDESHPVDVGYKEEGNNFVINASISADHTLTLSGKGETRDFDV